MGNPEFLTKKIQIILIRVHVIYLTKNKMAKVSQHHGSIFCFRHTGSTIILEVLTFWALNLYNGFWLERRIFLQII